jgi:hypothetical protein
VTRASLPRRPLLAGLAALPWLSARAQRAPVDAISTALDNIPGEAAFLPSYPGADTPQPLQNVAFLYDNALAAIVLNATGHVDAAKRIGNAILFALDHDRFWHDGRLRNAYRAGAVDSIPAALPGYWNQTARLWSEDAYQVGSASGNIAWAAIALLHLAPQSQRYADGARRLGDWLTAHTDDDGTVGGFFGEEPNPTPQNWHSTEHNIDAYAVLNALGQPRALACRACVARAFDPARGCFVMGDTSQTSALDASLWPLLAFADAPPDWKRSLDYVRAHFQAEGGLGFRENPDGIWTEGTAQGALTYALMGQADFAAMLLARLDAMRAEDGYLRAATHEIRTGLAIGPASTSDDFHYFPLPHLGATAWAALAFARVNPFQIPAISA